MSDRTSSWKFGPVLWYGPALVAEPWKRPAARLAGALALLVLVGASAASASGPANSLRDVRSLESRSHRALLDLYALDTRMHATQSRLAALRFQSARLRTEQALLTQQVAATRKTLRVSRHRLGDTLSLLYKQDEVSALAVMLGAQSLDDAVTRLDALGSVADESRQVVEAAANAQTKLTHLQATLHQQRQRLDGLRGADQAGRARHGHAPGRAPLLHADS